MSTAAFNLTGGHRFIFTAEGAKTRIDHELEMMPKGVFQDLHPPMGMMSKKNLLDLMPCKDTWNEQKGGSADVSANHDNERLFRAEPVAISQKPQAP